MKFGLSVLALIAISSIPAAALPMSVPKALSIVEDIQYTREQNREMRKCLRGKQGTARMRARGGGHNANIGECQPKL